MKSPPAEGAHSSEWAPASCRSGLAFVFLLCFFVGREQSVGSRVLAEHRGRLRSQQLSISCPPYSRRGEKPIFTAVAPCNALCSNFCISLKKHSFTVYSNKDPNESHSLHLVAMSLKSFLTSKLNTPPTFVPFFRLKLDRLSCRHFGFD